MTDPPQEPCGPQASPAGGVPAGPVVAALDEACWYGTRLISHGWIIRTVGASARGGYFVAETPHGRAVTVGPGHRRAVSDGAEEFADAITVLAATGAQHGHDYLRELMVLLAAHAAPRRPASLVWRTWAIPELPVNQQPTVRVRAAYWFAATLADDYGWQLYEVGSPTAGGGFIADIPAEAMAIYPASMPDDRTIGSALARMLPAMGARDLRTLVWLVSWHSAARAWERDDSSEW